MKKAILILVLNLFSFYQAYCQSICTCNPYLGCELFYTRHFHKIPGHPAFGGRFLLGDPYCINPEFPGDFYISSDGAEASEFEIAWHSCCGTNTNSPIMLVQLDDMGNEVGNTDPDNYGVFTLMSHTANLSTFKYKNPKKLPPPGIRDTFFYVYVYNVNEGYPMGAMRIHYYRPPVAMVHGLWGDPSGFKDMENTLINNGEYYPFQLKRADYHTTNARSFTTNQYIVEQTVEELIQASADNAIAAGKCNIVCHSMGGLLSRIYIQNPAYGSRKDVNKLITCNTPHYGSQMANFLLDTTQFGSVVADGLGRMGMNCYWGAVHDLMVNQPPINDIAYANPVDNVALHAVITFEDIMLPFGWTLNVIKYLSITTFAYSMLNTCATNFLMDMFDNDFSDGIVAVESQSGGLVGIKTYTVGDQVHTGSTGNMDVINHVEMVLNEPLNSSMFGNHYTGGTLNYSVAPCIPLRGEDDASERTEASVEIISPPNDSIVVAGDTIHIVYNATMVDSVVAAIVYHTDSIAFLGNSAAQGFIDFPMHSATFGDQSLVLFGVDTNKKIKAMDSINLHFITSATLDSISIYPQAFYLNQLDTSAITVTGHYSDGIERNLTNDASLSFQFDENNASRYNLNFIKMDSLADDSLRVVKNSIESVKVVIHKIGNSFPQNCKLVMNTNNSGAGSLRQAIQCAMSGDTILFAPSLVQDTIFLNTKGLTLEKSIYIINSNPGKIYIQSDATPVVSTFGANNVWLENIHIISGENSNACMLNYAQTTLKNIACTNFDNTEGKVINIDTGQLLLFGENNIK